MAITFGTPTSQAANNTFVTVNTPLAPGGGALTTSNLIWAVIYLGDVNNWTGAVAAGWTQALYQDAGAAGDLHVLVRQATGSDPSTYTFGNYGTGVLYGVMFATAGGNTTTPYQAIVGDEGTANGSTQDALSVTPTSADAMLFWCGGGQGNNASNTTTVSSTGTELYDLNSGALNANKRVVAGYYEQLASSSATGTRTITWSQSCGSRTTAAIAMNPAGGAPSMVQSVGMIPLN